MKKFTTDSYQEIKNYLHYNSYLSYNSNINTMIMWNHFYNISYECHEHYMIMLYSFFDMSFFFMPYCDKQYYKEAIDRMKSVCNDLKIPFYINFLSKNFVDFMLEEYPDQFLYAKTPYNDDYIYSIDEHLYLKGKKMQKRRNHYNYFIKEYPNYEFRILDKDKDRNDIITCFENWNESSNHKSSYELKGIINLLDHGIDIHCCGIYINNKIEAISLSSALNEEMVEIHVEKANKKIRGIYPALLKLTIESKYKGFKYINREDDIGIEGLRIAKTQLHPIYKLEKYELISKDFKFEKAQDDDFNYIKKLWLESFDDENELSANFYFEYIYNKDHTYKLINHNKIIGVIQLNPIELNDDTAYFIVGVCVKKKYHRQGCMDYMMNKVLEMYKGKNLILQAYNNEIYRKYGFKESHLFKEYFIPKESFNSNLRSICTNVNNMHIVYNAYLKNFDKYKARTLYDFELITKRSEAFGQKIICFDKGYIIYYNHENTIYISEIIYEDYDTFLNLIGYVNNYDVYVLTDENIILNFDYVYKTAMMSNNIKYNKINYINEIY